jgi:Regulatory phage protein cox.
MIEKGKLPVVEMTDPQSTSGRAGEYWVYLPAWNKGMVKWFCFKCLI